jgi:hypothetical protein
MAQRLVVDSKHLIPEGIERSEWPPTRILCELGREARRDRLNVGYRLRSEHKAKTTIGSTVLINIGHTGLMKCHRHSPGGAGCGMKAQSGPYRSPSTR